MKKVLIVDDEPDIRFILKAYLEDFQIEITEAEDGEAGLRCFEKESFDLVFTDMKMPKLDGEKLLNEIKKRKPDQKVVICSGSANEFPLASAVISKPFSFDQLEEIIKKLL